MDSWPILFVERLNIWPLKFFQVEDMINLLIGGLWVFWPMKWCLDFLLSTISPSRLCLSWSRRANLNSLKKLASVLKEKIFSLKSWTKILKIGLAVRKTLRIFSSIHGWNQLIEKKWLGNRYLSVNFKLPTPFKPKVEGDDWMDGFDKEFTS